MKSTAVLGPLILCLAAFVQGTWYWMLSHWLTAFALLSRRLDLPQMVDETTSLHEAMKRHVELTTAALCYRWKTKEHLSH